VRAKRPAAAELAGGAGGGDGDGVPAAARRAVWSDDADEPLRVPVASTSRLRKLRGSQEEQELDGGEYEARLRTQHEALNPRTAWARLPRRSGSAAARTDEEEEEEGRGVGALLRQSSEALVVATGGSKAGGAVSGGDALGLPLPAGELCAVRVRDGNAAAPAASVVRSVAFHASQPLLLAAGLDRSLRLFAVDGARNAQLAGVHFQDMPVHRAAFGGDGERIVLTGRRPFFYVYHLGAGRAERIAGIAGIEDKSLESFVESPQGGAGEPLLAFLADSGRIPLVSLASRQVTATLQMPGTARCAAFSPDGRTLLAGGGDGTVMVFDLRTHRCLDRLTDQGALSIASIATSPGGRYFATGGAAGVVNIYQRATRTTVEGGDAPSVFASPRAALRPVPLKSLGNLTTTVDTLQFSPDGQMLAMASRLSKDALRLVHLPSCTVFSNWPSSKTPMHYVHACAFSPHCGYFAAANARGRVLLYRLPHYDRL